MSRPALSRRMFLLLTGAGALLALPVTRWLRDRDTTREALHSRRPALQRCLDTLLPADALTPAATDLGLDTELLAELEHSPPARRRLYLQGLDWCEQQARTRYARSLAHLTLEECDAILHQAADTSPEAVPARFVLQLRDRAFALYYTHPEALTGITGAGPPQPAGYPDYARPPA